MTRDELAEALLPLAKSNRDIEALIKLTTNSITLKEDCICRMVQDSPWVTRSRYYEMLKVEWPELNA